MTSSTAAPCATVFKHIDDDPQNGLQHSLVWYEVDGAVSAENRELVGEAFRFILPDTDTQFGQMGTHTGEDRVHEQVERMLHLADGRCTVRLYTIVYRRVSPEGVRDILATTLRGVAQYVGRGV